MAIMQHKPNRVEDAVSALQPMIYKMAHKFARNHKSNDFDDLVQEAYVGLLKAYEKYDANAGCAFSSYAYQWIWAHLNGNRKYAYKYMNNIGFKPIEDETSASSYSLPLDEIIDAQSKIDAMDPLAKSIHKCRLAGFTYAAIAEQLTNLGKPMTLHQCRNHHLKNLEE